MPELVLIDWPSVRALAIAKLGEIPPHPEVEDELISVFEQHPRIVLACLENVATKIANGSKIRSGWRVWRSESLEARTARSRVSVTIDDPREKRVEQARAWMITQGAYLPAPAAMESQLFGIAEPTGDADELETLAADLAERYPESFPPRVDPLLRLAIAKARVEGTGETPPQDVRPLLAGYADDLQLRREMAELWLKVASQAAEVEAEADRRAAAYLEQRNRLAGFQRAVEEAPAEELRLLDTYVARARAEQSDEAYFHDALPAREKKHAADTAADTETAGQEAQHELGVGA